MSGETLPQPIRPIAPALEPDAGDGYVPGVCNIGPWEVRRRRAFAVVGFVAAAVLLAGLVASGAAPWTRLLILFPLWGGTFSWLQARRRFCAAYAMARVSNFGDGDATRQAVVDAEAHRADVAAVVRMTRDSFLIAVVPTLVVVVLPL
jgi:hypothetical protein